MTEEEIFQRAIEKVARVQNKPKALQEIALAMEKFGGYVTWESQIRLKTYYKIIFNHDFAKAFWGEQVDNSGEPAYLHNLAVMARWEAPLRYMEKFL